MRQALERGASDEEIKKLMDQLRAAMDKFLQALAEEMRKNPQQLARPLDRNTRTLSQQDLKSMLDRLEHLARSGNKDAARQLLEQLQSMLENLQMARPGASGGDDGDDDMMSALDELGDMIRKQQQLRDKTFKAGSGPAARPSARAAGPEPDGRPAPGPARSCATASTSCWSNSGSAASAIAGQGSRAARARATKWASSAMPARPWARPKASSARATPTAPSTAKAARWRPCERAPKGWRSRCSSTAWARAQRPARPRPGQRAKQETDPLGRPMRGRDYGDDVTVKVPGEIDAQRARRILEELRKRFGEGFRPQLELDYIERLLKDF